MMRSVLILALFAGALAGNIKIAPTKNTGLNLRQKIRTGEKVNETSFRQASTLAQTQQLLSQVFRPSLSAQARNLATRTYFRSVFRLPTTQQKMGATEAFLQSAAAYQRSIGRDPGTVERLTPNELEHWLTTEFLAEDFKDSMTGFGFLYPNVQLPAGLVSRGPAFAEEFRGRSGCASTYLKDGIADKKASLNYGTHCGNTNALGSTDGCDLAQKKVMRIQNDDRLVCADAGTDACCAQHDLIRTGININPVATFSSCKANSALNQCLDAVQPNQVFEDKRGVREALAHGAAKCIYNALPCLAKTKNRFYEINFKTKNMPHVRSIYPQPEDHHVQVVFPYDHSYGEDMTEQKTIYRKSMKADFEYSHWKHIDPPADYYGTSPSTFVDQPWTNSQWESLE